MKFSEIVEQARTLLQRQGRVSYRALKRELALEDDMLEDLKFELIEGQELAADKDGKVLVWTGTPSGQPAGSGEHLRSKSQSPHALRPLTHLRRPSGAN